MIPLWSCSGLNAALSFQLPLADLGAGAVNTTPGISGGSPTASFTRATSATCWSSAGLLLTVGTGVARSTYSELTGATYLGFLSEEARTNTCIQNRDFTNAAWVATTMTKAKDQVGIDGTASAASSLLATGANATVKQTITLAAVSRPFSVYIKRLTGTGVIQLAQDGATFTTQTVANDGLWHRCTLVASQLNPVLSILIATNGDKIAVDYAMLEDNGGVAPTNASPSSPIATTTVAVTRNADYLTYAFAGNASASAGTAYFEGFLPSGSGTSTAAREWLAFSNASGGLVQSINTAAATTSARMRDGTNVLDATGFSDFGTGVRKGVSRWNIATSLMSIFRDGSAPQSAAFDGAMDSIQLDIGNASAVVQINGTIKNVKIWTVALTDAQVQAL